MSRIRQRAVRGERLPGDEFVAKSRFHDHQLKCDVIKIMPGEFYVASGHIALATVLGSCVAACVWDPITQIGGMNHFMLANAAGHLDGRADSMRYGAFAMETLIRHVLAAGALSHSLQAKVFGGGQVLRGFTSSDVGIRNAEFVLDYLADQEIPVTGQDLGDVYPRKIYFFPDTGKVLMRRLPVNESTSVLIEEQQYRQRIAREA